jgi:hypothetical protein
VGRQLDPHPRAAIQLDAGQFVLWQADEEVDFANIHAVLQDDGVCFEVDLAARIQREASRSQVSFSGAAARGAWQP